MVSNIFSPLLKETGYINTGMIEMLDWYPTLAGLGGASTQGQILDGYDVWKTIRYLLQRNDTFIWGHYPGIFHT